MRNVLFVIPSLEFGGAAKQLTLLAPALVQEGIACTVCTLGEAAPWSDALARQGVRVEALSWRRRLDARPLLRLRDILRTHCPDIVHACHLAGLRAVVLAGGARGARLVVSPALTSGRVRWFDRWLLGRADRIVAPGAAEAEYCRRLGLPVERIAPGVEPEMVAGAADTVRTRLGLPASARLLVGIGPIEPQKGFHGAIWALDILRFLQPDLHLVLVGEGGNRAHLEEFARVARVADRVHFVGQQPSVTPWLAAAEVVWVPARVGGVNATLEAMAIGRPVLACRRPDLEEIIVDGKTGLFIPPGGRAALARQTQRLLEDSAQAQMLGEAGRQRVLDHFSPRALASGYLHLCTRAA